MAVKLKQTVELEGQEFTVTKLAGKEIRLESTDGDVKYRRVGTVERLLAEQKAARRQTSKEQPAEVR